MKKLMMVAIVCLTGGISQAATVYVDAAKGEDGPDRGFSKDKPVQTIQRAIGLSVDGDMIIVAPGTYSPFRVQAQKKLEIRSTSGAAKTVIDGRSEERCVTLPDWSDVIVDGFTLQNGYAAAVRDGNNGGGIYGGVVRNCIFKGNRANSLGGAAYRCQSVVNSRAEGNSASEGGAMNDCRLVQTCVIVGNRSEYEAGGLHDCNSIVDCVISNNVAGDLGGGISIYGSALVSNCVVCCNTAGAGGGIFAWGGTYIDCDIYGNTQTWASQHSYSMDVGGGGISGSDWDGGRAYGTFYNCDIHDNTAASIGGGALFARLYGCRVYRNKAPKGAGGYAVWAFSSLICDNASTGNGGGLFGGELRNCTVTGNSADGNGGGVCTSVSARDTDLYSVSCYNTIVYGNTAKGDGADGYLGRWYNSCVGYLYDDIDTVEEKMMFKNPKFADAEGRLAKDSPCLNAGDNAAVQWNYDLDGLPRIARGSVDVGAYEQQNVFTIALNANGGNCVTLRIKVGEAPVGTLPVAMRNGYTFEGWFTRAKDGEKVDEKSTVSSSCTLYAHWKVVTYTIWYYDGSQNIGYDNYTVEDEGDLPVLPAKSDMVFARWIIDNDPARPITRLAKGTTGTLSLTAVWEKGIELKVKSSNSKYGSVAGTGAYAAGAAVTLKATAKSGYAFAGWYTDKDCKKKLNPEGYDNREPKIKYTMPAKKTTIYAKFVTKAEDKKALKFSSTATTAAKKAQKASAGSSYKLSLGAKSATAVTWSASKLPSGLKIDKATGKITGKPTKPGKYTATVTVKTAAGNKISQKVKIYVTVPSGYYGTFDGYALVGTKPAYVTFTSDKYGAVSGKVTYKGKGYSFKASYSSTSSTKSKFTPSIKIGSTAYKPAVTIEKATDGITVSEARGEQKGKFVFVAQKKPGLIKSKKALAGLIDQPVKISNKQYADAKLPKSSDYLKLKFAATDAVKVSGKLKGKKVSFSTTVVYCGMKDDVYTAEVALIEPKSGYSRLATFALTVGKDGKVAKEASFGKIKAEE